MNDEKMENDICQVCIGYQMVKGQTGRGGIAKWQYYDPAEPLTWGRRIRLRWRKGSC